MIQSLNKRAEQDLSYIRAAMHRAEGVSTVSGWGIVAMGVVGLIAGSVAQSQADPHAALTVWLMAAPLAASIGAITSILKTQRAKRSLLADPIWRFTCCLVPTLIAAALLTVPLWQSAPELLPAVWMLLYGCGVAAAGTYAVRPIVLMGGGFILAGAVALATPTSAHHLLLTSTFGGLHIAFGWQVARAHGG